MLSPFLRTLINAPGRTEKRRRNRGPQRMEALEARVLLAAGDFDPTFDENGIVNVDFDHQDDFARDVVVRPDGGSLVVGWTAENVPLSRPDFAVAAFNNDGSLDNTFDADGLKAVNFSLTVNGPSRDLAFAAGLQSDGKLVVAGSSDDHAALIRLNVDGTLDTTFGSDGTGKVVVSQFFAQAGISFQQVRDIEIDAEDRIIAVGDGASEGIPQIAMIARFDTDGGLDGSFSADGVTVIATNALASGVAVDDSSYVVARTQSSQAGSNAVVIRVAFNGQVLNESNAAFGLPSSAHSVDIQGDGRVLVAGAVNDEFAVLRFVPVGTGFALDSDFDADGVVTPGLGSGSIATSVVAQGDNVLVGGYEQLVGPATSQGSVHRFRSDGSPDPAFGDGGFKLIDFAEADELPAPNGKVRALALSGSKILVAGHGDIQLNDGFEEIGLVRLKGDLPVFLGPDGLVVNGTNEDNGIEIIVDATTTYVDLDGESVVFRTSDIVGGKVRIDGAGGDDTINVLVTTGIELDGYDFEVNGGDGDDAVTIHMVSVSDFIVDVHGANSLNFSMTSDDANIEFYGTSTREAGLSEFHLAARDGDRIDTRVDGFPNFDLTSMTDGSVEAAIAIPAFLKFVRRSPNATTRWRTDVSLADNQLLQISDGDDRPGSGHVRNQTIRVAIPRTERDDRPALDIQIDTDSNVWRSVQSGAFESVDLEVAGFSNIERVLNDVTMSGDSSESFEGTDGADHVKLVGQATFVDDAEFDSTITTGEGDDVLEVGLLLVVVDGKVANVKPSTSQLGKGDDTVNIVFDRTTRTSGRGSGDAGSSEIAVHSGTGDDTVNVTSKARGDRAGRLAADVDLGSGNNDARIIVEGHHDVDLNLKSDSGDDILEIGLLLPAVQKVRESAARQQIDVGAGDDHVTITGVGFDRTETTANTDSGDDTYRANWRIDNFGGEAAELIENVELGAGDDLASSSVSPVPTAGRGHVEEIEVFSWSWGQTHTAGADDIRLTVTDMAVVDSNVAVFGGQGSDTLMMTLDGGSVSDSSFHLRAGGGDDTVGVQVDGTIAIQGTDISIGGGSGNDEVLFDARRVPIRRAATLSAALRGGRGDDTVVMRHTGRVDGTLAIDAAGGQGNDTLGTLVPINRRSRGNYDIQLTGNAGNDTGILAVRDRRRRSSGNDIFRIDGGRERDRLFGTHQVEVVNGEQSVDRPFDELDELLELLDSI